MPRSKPLAGCEFHYRAHVAGSGGSRGFAGDDIERAVFDTKDHRYLVERDLRVSHFQVTDD